MVGIVSRPPESGSRSETCSEGLFSLVQEEAPRSAGKLWRWFEVLALTVGVVCFSVVGYSFLDRLWSEQEMARAWDETPVIRGEHASRSPESLGPPVAAARARRGPAGRLEIPAIGLDAWVADGTDARTLRRSVGWIEGTARFGEPGNIGLAAHRDTHFRELGKLERGDRIAVTTDHGSFAYEVDSIRIVEPDQFEVLADGDRSSLSLVTCYPFRYVGRAPLRYVVRALEVGL